MTVERPAFLLVVLRDVDDKRYFVRVVDEVVTDPLGLPRIAFDVVLSKARVEQGFGHELAGRYVIGMAIRPVRRRHHARPVTPDERRTGREMAGMLADLAIGEAQVLAPGCAEDRARGLRLRQALFDRSVAAHLTRRHVAEADARTQLDMAGNRPADAD